MKKWSEFWGGINPFIPPCVYAPDRPTRPCLQQSIRPNLGLIRPRTHRTLLHFC